jgi:hypothetical protein
MQKRLITSRTNKCLIASKFHDVIDAHCDSRSLYSLQVLAINNLKCLAKKNSAVISLVENLSAVTQPVPKSP